MPRDNLKQQLLEQAALVRAKREAKRLAQEAERIEHELDRINSNRERCSQVWEALTGIRTHAYDWELMPNSTWLSCHHLPLRVDAHVLSSQVEFFYTTPNGAQRRIWHLDNYALAVAEHDAS